ncbi:MAG: energy transducer TonB, partial [Myxococcales bacterium]
MQTHTTRAGQRPGRMTTVMTTVPPAAGPRVLRVGLAQAGRILEEKTLAPRETVTIGPSERNTFVVVAAGLPACFTLFERVGPDDVLHVLEGMSGRVALPDGVVDLATLARPGRVTLTGDARGKVAVGDTTFLFQFEAPRPVPSRPQLPASVLSNVGDEIDWTMTIIAAFSFLIHFGAAGSMYSSWADRIVSDEVTLHGAALVVLTAPPRPPVAEEPRESDAITPSTPTDSKAPLDRTAHPVKAPSERGPSDGSRAPSSTNAAIGQQLARMEVEVMRALAAAGPVPASVLDGHQLPAPTAWSC